MDCPSFWKFVLDEGCSSDLLLSKLRDVNMFLDGCEQTNELETTKEYWPTYTDEWFEAFGGKIAT